MMNADEGFWHGKVEGGRDLTLYYKHTQLPKPHFDIVSGEEGHM